MEDNLKAYVGKLARQQKVLHNRIAQLHGLYQQFVEACESQPVSITEEIDSIPGRRIWSVWVATVNFTATQLGTRGAPLTFQISQDGPFIATHWPMLIWKPNEPATATHFGRWRPVSSWPLPDQVLDDDIIDLSWDFFDSGSQRAFQNAVIPPMFSRPDALEPLPVPTIFSPNSALTLTPTYEAINFGAPAVPTTGGELVGAIPGYRIVNL